MLKQPKQLNFASNSSLFSPAICNTLRLFYNTPLLSLQQQHCFNSLKYTNKLELHGLKKGKEIYALAMSQFQCYMHSLRKASQSGALGNGLQLDSGCSFVRRRIKYTPRLFVVLDNVKYVLCMKIIQVSCLPREVRKVVSWTNNVDLSRLSVV